MSEIEALLGLYGAIDRAVVARVIDPATIAPLLGAYSEDVEGGPATGWYDNQYLPWVQRVLDGMRERGEVAPELDDSRLVDRPLVERPVIERLRGDQLRADLLRDDLPDRDDFLLRQLRADAELERLVPDGERQDEVDLSPEDAIREALEAFEEIPADDRTAAHRLLAVAVAALGLPQFFGADGEYSASARKALTFVRTDVEPGYAQQLTRQLHIEFTHEFTAMDRWSEVIQGLVAQELLPQTMYLQSSAMPCTGSLVWDPPGSAGTDDPTAAVILSAWFETDEVSFDRAIRYLQPVNWEYPKSLWIRMDLGKKVRPASWIYHESVSATSPLGTWVVSTDLLFTFGWNGKKEARVHYDLPAGWPKAGGDIVVDTGTLRILKQPGKIRVETTKRVRFSGSFDGPGLAMFMCATGYTSVLEKLVLKIAKTALSSTVPFPIPPPV